MSTFVEIPASRNSLARRSLIYGVGINDAKYIVYLKTKERLISCPYYMTWKGMITRCYSTHYQEKHNSYIECFVDEEWLLFSNFKRWMEEQDWKGKQLDKDILVVGNKIYSKHNCLFVSGAINKLLTDCFSSRGECPQGVHLNKNTGKYTSSCSLNGKIVHLGSFDCESTAELAYIDFKLKAINQALCSSECVKNEKLREALQRHTEVFKDRALTVSMSMN